MSYNKKILLVILPLITVVVALTLNTVLSVEIDYEEIAFSGFRCRVAAGLEHKPYDRDGWSGVFSQSPGGARWAYTVTKQQDPGTPLRGWLRHLRRPAVLAIDDGLIFAVEARGKSRRRYIYLLSTGDRVVWLESGSAGSTLIHCKRKADRMLATLADSGGPLVKQHREITDRTTRFVMPRYSQSILFFMLLLLGVMTMVALIMLLVFHFSGLPPREAATDGRLLIRPVTIKLSVKPLGRQMFDGLLQARNGAMDVYSFRKKRFSIEFSGITRREQVRIGTTRMLKQPYLGFSYPGGKKVTFPGRRRPLLITGITLYMNADRIRDLVRVAGFPFQDELIIHPLLRG